MHGYKFSLLNQYFMRIVLAIEIYKCRGDDISYSMKNNLDAHIVHEIIGVIVWLNVYSSHEDY